MKSEAPTPVEGVPRRMPIEDTEITPTTRVRWPLIGILAGAAGIAAVAIVAGERYSQHERATTAVQAAIEDGGIVSKKTLRTVLREIRLVCDQTAAGGIGCRIEIPKEAD